MKKYIFLTTCFFILSTLKQVTAQVIVYNYIKTTSNYFDKDMQAYTGWKGWEDVYVGRRAYTANTLSVSQNAIKISHVFSLDIEGYDDPLATRDNDLYNFIADEPTAEFPFRKKVSIKSNNQNSNPEKPQLNYNKEVIGVGYIYSKTAFDKIMTGNAVTEIYVYYEMDNKEKGFIGYYINRYTKAELDKMKDDKAAAEQDRIDELAEAKAEKKRKETEAYKNLGKVIGTLLQKKRN